MRCSPLSKQSLDSVNGGVEGGQMERGQSVVRGLVYVRAIRGYGVDNSGGVVDGSDVESPQAHVLVPGSQGADVRTRSYERIRDFRVVRSAAQK